jgi:hypothetical protein
MFNKVKTKKYPVTIQNTYKGFYNPDFGVYHRPEMALVTDMSGEWRAGTTLHTVW